jgi:hypothetical protein
MLIAFSVSARLADNNHYRTPRARARSRLSLLSTPPLPQPRRVNRLVRTLPQQPGTRGLTTPFPFPALLSTSARFVFALSMLFFVLMFRFLHRTRNTHSAKRPVLQRPLRPELAPMCLHWGLARVLRVSGEMPFTCQCGGEGIRDAFCLTEPEPARPQGSPKAGLYQFGGVCSRRRHSNDTYCRSRRGRHLVLTTIIPCSLHRSCPCVSRTSSQISTLHSLTTAMIFGPVPPSNLLD